MAVGLCVPAARAIAAVVAREGGGVEATSPATHVARMATVAVLSEAKLAR